MPKTSEDIPLILHALNLLDKYSPVNLSPSSLSIFNLFTFFLSLFLYSLPSSLQSFENNGFLDLDYADPTPLMHDTSKDDDEDNVDLDSGYQEPQEILSTRIVSNSHNHSPIPAQTHYNPHNGQYTTESRSAGTRRKHRHQGNTFHGSRPVVSSPTRIENPNVLPPLNLFPNQTQSQSQSPATTMGRYQAQTTATIGGRGKSKYVTTVGAATDRNGTASLNRKINDFSASRNCANI